MMEALRPLSILPAIKCSTCGAEIEISSMGEHVCASSSLQEKKQNLATMPVPATALTSNSGLEQSGRRGDYSTNPPVNIKTGSPWERSSRSASASASSTGRQAVRSVRTAPPRIDPTAANKPYTQRELLTPGAPTSSALRSPTSPYTGNRPRKQAMIRSMTSPIPRIHRPPSPKMSSNLDCAFPPFPTSRPSNSSSKPASTSSPVNQGEGQSTLGAGLHAEPESYTGPRSPRTTGGADVMQRMNSTAPGPFDARVRSSSEDVSSGRRSASPKLHNEGISNHVQQTQLTSPITTQDDLRPRSPLTQPQQVHPSPTAFISVAPPTNRVGRPVPQRPVRPEPLDGFLMMLKNETEASAWTRTPADSKTRTLPQLQVGTSTQQLSANDAKSKGLSESKLHAGPAIVTSGSGTPSSLTNSCELETRASPASRPGVPPMPPLSTVQAITHQHKAHTPSDSASSTSSIRSFEHGSFRSDLSPPISATSSISMLSTSLDENFRDQDPSLAVPSLQIRQKTSQTRLRVEESRPIVTPQSLYEVPTPSEESSVRLPSSSALGGSLESPVAPSTQGLQIQPLRRSPAPQGPLPLLPSTSSLNIQDDPRAKSPANRPAAKRPSTASKHHCRGCKDPITGKSVKAADGRLTGRWHKHCFVCQTCHSPFATADFYVIDNNPYCEQHYHKLNNSLCAKCDRGIEGPYLDTQQGQKFHPECFVCHECHKILSGDYFEINGFVHCEQHARTKLRQQEGLGPKRDMERRRTRLMMMGDRH